MRVLDSTDPAAVAATVDDLDPLATLFIISSKSGTTVEALAFFADAWDRISWALAARDANDISPAGFSLAITDPGRSLEAIPHHDDLREVFLNPPDIGGRYSALTYVGLVPASLIGLDLDALLGSAQAMAARCRSDLPHDNAGVALGLALGVLARTGRDKVTFLRIPRSRRSAPGRSSCSPSPPASTASGSSPSTASRSGLRTATPRTVSSCGCRSRAPPRTAARTTPWAGPTASRRRSNYSAIPSSGSHSRIRWTSPVSSIAGRSRPRSRASCSESTRSTSPTSRRQRRTRGACSPCTPVTTTG